MIPFMICLGKIVADAAVSLRLLEDHLARHIFVAGGTGGGKSKLLEQFVRQLVRQEAGVTVIDPHGDLTLALMIYLALRGVDPRRVHYVAPGADRCCAIDPFAGAPTDCSLHEYEAWLSSACDRVISAFLRNVSAADRELMKRLKRWAKNIFFVCGYDVDGTHEGLAKALVLTDPENPEFERIVERVRPYASRTDFGREVMLDFDKLRDTKGARQREQWIESTINMLKEVLGPVMRLVFGQHAPSLSQRDIILSRGIQLVNVAKSDALSREQANAIGGLIINLLIHAAENIGQERPYEARVPHYLVIDEAENFIGDDLRAGFGELRKFKLVLVISFQDLSCMQKGDMDLKPKVVSQCAIQITFHQGNPDDVEYLGKSFAYGGLDFTPLLDKRIVPDGYDYVLLSNTSVSTGTGVTRSTSTTESRALARARGWTEAEGINDSVSLALSATHSEGTSFGTSFGTSSGRSHGINVSEGASESDQVSEALAEGKTESSTFSDSRGYSSGAGESVRDGLRRGSPTHADYGALDRTRTTSAGTSENHTSAVGSGQSETRTAGQTHGNTTTQNQGASLTWSREESASTSHGSNNSDSLGVTSGAARGTSKSLATTESESEARAAARGSSVAAAENRTVSRGVSVAPLARHREEVVETGSLKKSVQDQIAEVMNLLASLPDRVVLVKVKGMGRPFLLRINDVLDPYEERVRDRKIGFVPRSRAWREHELSAYLDCVFDAHAYNFVPDQTPFDEPIVVDARPREADDTVLA